MRAMRGNVLETIPFQPFLVYTESFLTVLSNPYIQAMRAMSKTCCDRTLATVLWAPLSNIAVLVVFARYRNFLCTSSACCWRMLGQVFFFEFVFT